MGKILLQEIAAVLTEKNGIGRREANSFAAAMFALIQERLETDQLVKVKGLGTFKIIDVEARESVSVRTGERVTISGHSKVSFTPDATMKELVNKPFSQFETVVLNDGVEFEDVKEETPATFDEQTEEPEVAVVTEATMQLVDTEAEPADTETAEEMEIADTEAEAPDTEAEPADAETSTADEETEPTDAETSTADEETEAEQEEENVEKRSWGSWLLACFGMLALMALSAFGGYYYGSKMAGQTAAVVPDTVMVRDTVLVSDVESIAELAEEPDVETDESLPEQAQTTDKPAAEPKADKPAVEPKVDKPAPEPKKAVAAAEPADNYAQKDVRVRLGAYRIVGQDHEVKVQGGQTFSGICRAHLGPDMECYVEVFNNLPKNPTVKVGQVIKIPKLELKKRQKR